MEDYNSFKNFIDNHYNLEHLRTNNYLKFVKVSRQKIVLSGVIDYNKMIDDINNIFKIMNDNYLFYRLNFRKYLFNIKKINSLFKKREIGLKMELERFEELYDYFKKKNIKFKLLKTINLCNRKIQLFNMYKRQVLYLINNFIKLESKYGIDQKLINIVNSERTLIGKKSEYNVNKLISKYVDEINDNYDQEIYIYLENIDIFKLFNIKINTTSKCKGEVDGLILKKEDDNYIIEHLIETKSSIKAIFEDIHKIIGLKKIFLDYNFDDEKYIGENIKINKKSFEKIENYNIHDWLIYICNDDNSKIDKSHLYFSYVLKIIDYNFIKDYYVNNNYDCIKLKHNLILKNTDYINNLFSIWKNHVNLTINGSCIYILK
jgi:hypothetical protein